MAKTVLQPFFPELQGYTVCTSTRIKKLPVTFEIQSRKSLLSLFRILYCSDIRKGTNCFSTIISFSSNYTQYRPFFFFYDSLSEFMFLYWKVQTRSRDCVVTALSKVSRMLSHQKKTNPLSQLSAVFNPGRQLSTTQPLPHSPQVRWGRELGR